MNILLCDDHLMFNEALAFVLEARGWKVVARTASPAEAVATLTQEDVDVCLLDLHFPGVSGLDSVPELLRASPPTRLVVLSATADRSTVAMALASGAGGFVTKSCPLDRIVDVVTRVAAGEVVVDGVVDDRQSGHEGTPDSGILAQLTAREAEVLQHLVAGQSPAALAGELCISYATARSHVQRVLMKLGVHSQLEAVAYAISRGWPQ